MTENNPEDTTRQKSLYHITTDRELTAKQLINRSDTIPFSGLSESTSYPDSTNEDTIKAENRFEPEVPLSLATAINVLPEASLIETYGRNKFAEETESGEVNIDTEAIKDVDGVDIERIESAEGRSIEELAADANPQEVLHIPHRKVVSDDRRQALKNLGFEVKFSWKIGSNQYTPLEVRQFFDQKISVLKENGIHNAFGWIRHRSWGGNVTVNTIYPGVKRELTPTEETDVEDSTPDEFPLTTAEDPQEDTTTDSDEAPESKVAYFGDQIRYAFESTSILTVKPIVYFPEDDLMLPLELTGEQSLTRKQMGSLMEDISGFHERAFSDIEQFAREIDETIQQARKLAIDFSVCDFSMEEFYEYIGIGNDTYIESAVERVKRFADPPQKPTIWNLQLSLKRTLIEECNSNKAADTYQGYQEIAGQLLQDPEVQLSIAIAEHERRAQEETDTDDTDENATTISDFNISDVSGISENNLSANQAEKVQNRIDSRLDS